MAGVRATVHGAISIVNAIATRKGATLGIGLEVSVTAEAAPGHGIVLKSRDENLSSRLVRRTVERTVPGRLLRSNRIILRLESEIPTGYGLKSSSAISSAVALACSGLFQTRMSDRQILLAGVRASIETRVSITGAYDDACACYYGGFNVTDNARLKRVHSEDAPSGLAAVIFVPKKRRRGNLKNLKRLSGVFGNAWGFALKSRYWEAMTMNGLATSAVLDTDPAIIASLLENGAYGASMSGNGPAIAAVTRKGTESRVKKAFAGLEGRTIISGISNSGAVLREV